MRVSGQNHTQEVSPLWKDFPVTASKGWDSVFRITPCYGLEGPGIEWRWGRVTELGAHRASSAMVTGSCSQD